MDGQAVNEMTDGAPQEALAFIRWMESAETAIDRVESELIDAALAFPHLGPDLIRVGTDTAAVLPMALLMTIVTSATVFAVFALTTRALQSRRDAAARDSVPFVAVLKLTGWSFVPLLASMAVGRVIVINVLGPDGPAFPREFLVGMLHWLTATTLLGIVFRPRIARLRLISLDAAGAEIGLRYGALVLALGHLQSCLLAAALRNGVPAASVKLLAILSALLMAAMVFRLLHMLRRRGLKPMLHGVFSWLVIVVLAAWVWGWALKDFDLYRGIKGTVIAILIAVILDRSIALSLELSRKPDMMRRLFVLRVAVDAIAAAVTLRVMADYWLVGTFGMVGEDDWSTLSRRLNIALFTLVLAAIASAATHAFIESRMMQHEALADADEQDLKQGRLSTVLPLVRLGLISLILSAFSIVALSAIGLDTTPVVAGAGIVGLAVSLGSQALVKDVISGIFWMLDDAFRLGEDIEIDEVKGRVEQIHVRSLRLRAEDGRLHTIPFGQISTVASHSRRLVRLRVSLVLKEDAGPARRARLLKLAANTLRSETMLQEAIVGKITIIAADPVGNPFLTFEIARAAARIAAPKIRSLLQEELERLGFELMPEGVLVSMEDHAAAPAPDAAVKAASTP